MHPGGTNIIKSNGGVDCTKSFDLLAHTNNPEVSSLLTKYYIGELTPKPAYHAEDLSMLYDLWKGYLHTATEQVVASHFEVGMITESSIVWFQQDLLNMGGVRRFYHYQSRLLQGGFSTLFGSKLQELCLKISFTLANARSTTSPIELPDVLGVIARATGSADAIKSSNEISQIGHLTCNSESARHHEKGIIAYAQRSVQYDMEFLESIREEACNGMDAFDAVMELEVASDSDRIASLSHFLMQVLERMANKLEAFYGRIARHSVFEPTLESNPARARWNILRSKITDGSFFILTREMFLKSPREQQYHRIPQAVGFDQVVSRVEGQLHHSSFAPARYMDLNEQHTARAKSTTSGAPVYEQHAQISALKAMSNFMDVNKKAIRRLSKLPQTVSLEHLMQTYGSIPQTGHGMPTPPSSRSSSTSTAQGAVGRRRSKTANDAYETRDGSRGRSNAGARSMPTARVPVSPAATMSALMTKMNTRLKRSLSSLPSQSHSDHDRVQAMRTITPQANQGVAETGATGEMAHTRSRSTAGNLRSFRLQASAMAGAMTRRSDTLQS